MISFGGFLEECLPCFYIQPAWVSLKIHHQISSLVSKTKMCVFITSYHHHHHRHNHNQKQGVPSKRLRQREYLPRRSQQPLVPGI